MEVTPWPSRFCDKSSANNLGKFALLKRLNTSLSSIPRLTSRSSTSLRKSWKLFRRTLRPSLPTRKQLSSSFLGGISYENPPNKACIPANLNLFIFPLITRSSKTAILQTEPPRAIVVSIDQIHLLQIKYPDCGVRDNGDQTVNKDLSAVFQVKA